MTQNTLYPKTKPKGRGVIPFGYAHNKDTNMLEAIPGYLEVLENTVNGLLDESIPSLREGLVYIKSELGQDVKISHQTLSNYLEKAGGKPTRQYTYHSEVKAKMSAKKAFNQNKNTVKALEKKLTKAKTQLKKKTTTLKKLDEPADAITNEGKIVDLEILPENVKAEAVKDNVIFAPNEGPQTEFLAAAETDVLYGGAAGGGKSYAMLVDPLRYAHRAAHRALIIRRSMPELRELIDKSRELYPKAFPGCKYREVEKLWNFPSGAKVEFGVGVIPGGGGSKEMALRASDAFQKGDVELNILQENFLTIGMAKVSTSAYEAFDLGLLQKGKDVVVVNKERQIAIAKSHAKLMAETGYTQPIKRKDVRVLGKQALGMFLVGTDSMEHSKYISAHDKKIANKLAYVMAGGDLSEPTLVSEQYLLDIEREAFLSLCSERKTIERIEHMLKTGKPLRN